MSSAEHSRERADRNNAEVLVLGGGQGRRLGRGPKALVSLAGRTLLEHSVASALQLGLRTLVALPPPALGPARRLVPPEVELHEGGTSRLDSLRRLFPLSRAELILIHDVAHPLAGAALFRAVLSATRRSGVAIPAVAHGEFVYRQAPPSPSHGALVGRLERVGGAWLAQSPKGIRRELLGRALTLAQEQAPSGQLGLVDLLELLALEVETVMGAPDNIKVTTTEDLAAAERLLGGNRSGA